jgi:hypothetical protein
VNRGSASKAMLLLLKLPSLDAQKDSLEVRSADVEGGLNKVLDFLCPMVSRLCHTKSALSSR